MENGRKQLVNEGTSLNKEYANQVDNLKRTKSDYERACKEAELAQKTFDTVKSDGVTKAKDLPKFEKEAAKKNLNAKVADEVYKKRVEETNNFFRELLY